MTLMHLSEHLIVVELFQLMLITYLLQREPKLKNSFYFYN